MTHQIFALKSEVRTSKSRVKSNILNFWVLNPKPVIIWSFTNYDDLVCMFLFLIRPLIEREQHDLANLSSVTGYLLCNACSPNPKWGIFKKIFLYWIFMYWIIMPTEHFSRIYRCRLRIIRQMACKCWVLKILTLVPTLVCLTWPDQLVAVQILTGDTSHKKIHFYAKFQKRRKNYLLKQTSWLLMYMSLILWNREWTIVFPQLQFILHIYLKMILFCGNFYSPPLVLLRRRVRPKEKNTTFDQKYISKDTTHVMFRLDDHNRTFGCLCQHQLYMWLVELPKAALGQSTSGGTSSLGYLNSF